jgi:hypothetical protein
VFGAWWGGLGEEGGKLEKGNTAFVFAKYFEERDSLSVSVPVSLPALVLEREDGLAEWEKMRNVSRPWSLSAKWTFLRVDGAERVRRWRGWMEGILGEEDLKEDLRGLPFGRTMKDGVREY